MGERGVVVVTGASSGIGRCTAERFARDGWRVGLIARGAVGLAAAEAALPGCRQGAPALSVAADVTDPEALARAAERIEAALGPIAVWVNGAGCGTYARFADTSEPEFRRVTEVTYLGAVNGTREALRHLLPRDAGAIVNIGSAVVHHGMPLLASYSGAKAALRAFDQAVRAELALDGSRVRLTTLLPPAVNTPFFDHALSRMGRPGRPLPPVHTPQMVAEAVWLAARGAGGEISLGFTTKLFALTSRRAPWLLRRAIRQLGYEGSLSQQPEAAERYDPTLLAPSPRAPAREGAYGKGASSGRMHLGLLRLLDRVRR